jgi:hypothetical protein
LLHQGNTAMNIKDKEKAKFISSQKIKEKTGFPPDLKN